MDTDHFLKRILVNQKVSCSGSSAMTLKYQGADEITLAMLFVRPVVIGRNGTDNWSGRWGMFGLVGV